LAGNLVKPLLSLYGAEWRERGYGLRSLLHAYKEKSPEITVGGFGYKNSYSVMFVAGWVKKL
jgi:hypothetical protein